jgi:hypothetical protein
VMWHMSAPRSAARISVWVCCRLLAPRRRLTLLGALKVTPGSCDAADDVRLGGAFLGPDHEFPGVPFIACQAGKLAPISVLSAAVGAPSVPLGLASHALRGRVLDQREQDPEARAPGSPGRPLDAPFVAQTSEFWAVNPSRKCSEIGMLPGHY